MNKTDEKYMHRCLDLAKNGLGNTYPNPLVGSVIVHNNRIVGEGYHTQAGKPHAEINAINSVKNKKLLKNSTLYVNLEPCSHYGKTPPCAKKIADLKIPRVVVGTIDTTAKVSGKGIRILQNAKIDVTIDVLKNKSRELNKRFFTFHEKKRPYVILKWAQSADGFIDIIRSKNTPIEPNWITGKHERQLVHKWRAEEQSILVGTNTVIKDNPTLTTRDWYGKNPVRMFIDKKCVINKNYNLFNNTAKTICFNNKIEKTNDKKVDFIKLNNTNNYFEQILSYLYQINIQSIIVEGGQYLLQSIIEDNLWDEAKIFIGNKYFKEGIIAPRMNFEKNKSYKFDNSSLLYIKNHEL